MISYSGRVFSTTVRKFLALTLVLSLLVSTFVLAGNNLYNENELTEQDHDYYTNEHYIFPQDENQKTDQDEEFYSDTDEDSDDLPCDNDSDYPSICNEYPWDCNDSDSHNDNDNDTYNNNDSYNNNDNGTYSNNDSHNNNDNDTYNGNDYHNDNDAYNDNDYYNDNDNEDEETCDSEYEDCTCEYEDDNDNDENLINNDTNMDENIEFITKQISQHIIKKELLSAQISSLNTQLVWALESKFNLQTTTYAQEFEPSNFNLSAIAQYQTRVDYLSTQINSLFAEIHFTNTQMQRLEHLKFLYSTHGIHDYGFATAFAPDITPLSVPPAITLPGGAIIIPVTDEASLRFAITNAANTNSHTAVQLMNNVTLSSPAPLQMNAGLANREVHIFSYTGSMDEAHSIIMGETVTGRHINLNASRQLHLWNVTLTRQGVSNPTAFGGGVSVGATARLYMHAGSTISNNRATNGGGVELQGTARLTMDNAIIENNIVTGSGGAVWMANTGNIIAYIDDSIIRNNEVFPRTGATMLAGGINVNSNTLTITGDSEICTNFAFLAGGINVSGGGTVNMQGGSVQNNEAMGNMLTAGGTGGGIRAVNGANLYITGDALIFNNRALNGGGIYVNNSTVTIGTPPNGERSGDPTIRGNTSIGGGTQNGGGIRLNAGSDLTIYYGTIEWNVAYNRGAGIGATNGSTITMYDGLIYYNRSLESFAGVYISGTNSVFHMYYGKITNNHALRPDDTHNHSRGGGVAIRVNARFYMHGGEISGNTARNGGAGVLAWGSSDDTATFTMNGGLIYNNTVLGSGSGTGANMIGGGGVRIQGAIFNFNGGTIYNNTSMNVGGGILFLTYLTQTTLSIGEYAAINSNTSAMDGAGMWLGSHSPTIAGTIIMDGGEIDGNTSTNGNGGGIWLADTSPLLTFTMDGGSITNNTANNGGGLFTPFVPIVDLSPRLTIAEDVKFYGNVARDGLFIHTPQYIYNRPHIVPGSVSVPGRWELHDCDFDLFEHAFTNYDINVPEFECSLLKVSFEVGDPEGTISAAVTCPTGTTIPFTPPYSQEDIFYFFVPSDTEVTLTPTPDDDYTFRDWLIFYYDNDNDVIDPEYPDEESNDNPLVLTITENTHIIGNFAPQTTVSIKKLVTGGLANENEYFYFTIYILDDDEYLEADAFDFTLTCSASNTPACNCNPAYIQTLLTYYNRFRLRHGQTIEFDGMPGSAYIRVVEDDCTFYQTWVDVIGCDCTDCDATIFSRDSGYHITADLAYGLQFHFTNYAEFPPPMNAFTGFTGRAFIWFGVLASALFTIYFAVSFKQKSYHTSNKLPR